jgi:L-seryl-tRNA(Ser) seleniumtransferase
MKVELLKKIPQVDALMKRIPPEYYENLENEYIKRAVRAELDELRGRILNGENPELSEEGVLSAVCARLERLTVDSLVPVINATGIIVHTNLGRAILSEELLDHTREVLTNYSTLEFDLETGKRGSRYVHAEKRLAEITGAEAALVVNNNAAAVMLILNTMAAGKEVVVSRGELVEIGGSFRVPDVMAASGCILKEVGTTNKTHVFDYEKAIGEQTGLLMKTHTSNYKIVGFTESVDIGTLAEIGKARGIPVYEDLGSGTIYPLGNLELPSVPESVAKGLDLISFSGDKVFGSVQCGIIIGKKAWIDRLKVNPLLRAFRMDKYTLALLEATLKLYLKREHVLESAPTLHMIAMDQETVKQAVERFVDRYRERLNDCGFVWTAMDLTAEIGGGSTPGEGIPSFGLELSALKSPARFQRRLRQFEKPIIATLSKDCVYLDFRTVFERDFQRLMEGLEFADA